jgi:hypothetical protein
MLAVLFLSDSLLTGLEEKVKKSKTPENKQTAAIIPITRVLFFLGSSGIVFCASELMINPFTKSMTDQGN